MTYAWYGQGTRFLDISRPENPIQVAYYRPDDGNVWASYLHKGYIYTADAGRGVDVLRFTRGAKAATAAQEEVVAPKMNAKQQRTCGAWRSPSSRTRRRASSACSQRDVTRAWRRGRFLRHAVRHCEGR